MREGNRFVESLERRSLLSSISGVVHNDWNGSGAVDEFGLVPATVVYLDQNENGRHDRGERSVVTDASGRFTFQNLTGGKYRVRLEPPPGWGGSNAAARVGSTQIIAGRDEDVSVPTMLIRYRSIPWATAGQNQQYTGTSPFRGGTLETQVSEVKAEESTDPLARADNDIKFGTPLVTTLNTVIVPVFFDSTDTFGVRAYSRSFGVVLWTFVSDYVRPPSVQINSRTVSALFQPALGADGQLYVPGAAGTVHVIGRPDRIGTGVGIDRKIGARRLVFYGKQKYAADRDAYEKTVFINTPLTVDRAGNVFFGVVGTRKNPAKVGSSLARVRADGTGHGVRIGASVATGSAPVLSHNERHVYVITRENGRAELVRFAAVEGMWKAGSVELRDPKTRQLVRFSSGVVTPVVVAPDGDVYVATEARAKAVRNTGNGWLRRFSQDLRRSKAFTQVRPDAMPSIVPASAVKWYRGSSNYLVAAARISAEPGAGGVPNQRIALYDPARGIKRQPREYLVLAARSGQNFVPGIASNQMTVDPSSRSIYLLDASAQLHRWNFSDLLEVTEPVALADAPEIGSYNVMIGPDGQVYVVAGFKLWGAF